MSSSSPTATLAASEAKPIVSRPPLRTRLSKHRISWLLLLPVLLFLLTCFVWPIATVLWRSVENPEVRRALPETLATLKSWNGRELPDEASYRALAEDLRTARDRGAGLVPTLGKRLGYDDAALSSLPSVTLSALRKIPVDGTSSMRDQLVEAVPLWGQVSTWKTVVRAGTPLTSHYQWAAIDRRVDPITGEVVKRPAEQALYVDVMLRTLWISAMVTLGCVLLGYPLAYWLSRQPTSRANLLMLMVLLPFWTSLLVRTAGWIVLLQSAGILNRALIWMGLIDKPLELVFNRTGVYIAMTHILLPFIILPLYAVMKGISGHYVRAAISLGAHPIEAFWRVYVPQTYSGLTAGALLVFIMAIGYYITPALLGGPDDQMASYFVAYYTNSTINWGMAAALGSQLLIVVLLLYVIYARATRPTAVKPA
ncbi:ABC transporter permease [Herbaspirillum sp. DW155]|uniref:ABC transporter permease n=1 Tax=Herbaspirillum sp. DW155 TaxID=3095609 RepID=UPI00309287DB|nr:ABC transporter permease [Herbaspirillum sp. DW155]